MKVNINYFLILLSLTASTVIFAGNDPTRPDVLAPKASIERQVRTLKLTMIQHSETIKRAVINGRSYTVGDTIGSYRIKSISQSDVLLQNNKGTVRLSLITKGALRKKS